MIFVVLFVFALDNRLFWLRSGCDHSWMEEFLRLGLVRWLCCARFTVYSHFSRMCHRNLAHVNELLIMPRNLFAFVLFVLLAQVFGEGLRLFVVSLHFGCEITWLGKGIDHLLHGFKLFRPSVYVCVHVLHECSWRSSFHLVHRNIVPLTDILL